MSKIRLFEEFRSDKNYEKFVVQSSALKFKDNIIDMFGDIEFTTIKLGYFVVFSFDKNFKFNPSVDYFDSIHGVYHNDAFFDSSEHDFDQISQSIDNHDQDFDALSIYHGIQIELKSFSEDFEWYNENEYEFQDSLKEDIDGLSNSLKEELKNKTEKFEFDQKIINSKIKCVELMNRFSKTKGISLGISDTMTFKIIFI